jgi:hypothetical protein
MSTNCRTAMPLLSRIETGSPAVACAASSLARRVGVEVAARWTAEADLIRDKKAYVKPMPKEDEKK